MTSDRTKIVYIDESRSIGGAEEYLKIILKGLSNSFAPLLIHPNDSLHIQFYEDIPIDKEVINADLYDKPARLAKQYHALLRKTKTELLHVNLPAPNYCRSAIIAARLAGIHTIIATSHLPNLTFPRSMLGMLAGRSVWDWLMWRVIFNSLSSTITVSKSSAGSLGKNYPVKNEKIACIPNGIDCSRFSFTFKSQTRAVREEFGISTDNVLVTSVGRLHPQKGYADLLKATQAVVKRHDHVKVLLVGDGPLETELHSLSEKLNLNDKVIFAGRRDDIPEILSATDIYVNSSLFEGLPFSILEAMAAGVAVVGTSVDGNKEVIINDKTGVLVPCCDPDSLADAINLLVGNKNIRSKLGQEGQKLIQDEYTIDNMVLKTEQLYQTTSRLNTGR